MGASTAHDLRADMTVLDLVVYGAQHDMSPAEAFRAWWETHHREARTLAEAAAETSGDAG